jgi:hypothetical protein
MADTTLELTSPELDTPPFEFLRLCATAFYLSRCLQIVVEAGVPDALGDEPATAPALAIATGLDAQALARALKLLAANGIFKCCDSKFAHTPASRLLRDDEAQSMRSFIRLFGQPVMWTAAQHLDRVMKAGCANPDDFWSHLDQNPLAAQVFNDSMTEKARSQAPLVIASYDFSPFASIADIGGGRGHLIEAILAASPASKGTLFDLPRVTEQISHRASDRLTLQGGNFFQDELPRCDAYILMEVIHDWPDEEAGAILKAVRKSAPDDARLLLIEALMPSDPRPAFTRTLDIVMLTHFGGARQRTVDEYRSMLDDAAFRLENVIDIGAGYSILEAVAV